MEKEMIELSVVVPVYNGEKYLFTLLESISKIQAVTVEVIVIDDGSTDGSREVIERYQKKDKRISYFWKDNGGIVSARNYGLNIAKGEFLFFADQDDKLDSEVVEKTVLKMKEQNADVALFSTQCFTDSGRYWDCDKVVENGVYGEEDIGNIFIRKLVTRYSEPEIVSYIGHIWSTIIRRQLVVDNMICFKRFIAIDDDLFFVLDALDNAKNLVAVKDTGYYWRQNPSSRTHRARYTENQVQKMKNYYEYRTNILLKHQICSSEELEDYYIGVRQEFMLNLLDNEARLGVFNSKANEILKRYCDFLEIKEALKDKAKCPLAERYCVEKKLLLHRSVRCAILYKKIQYWKNMLTNALRKYSLNSKK